MEVYLLKWVFLINTNSHLIQNLNVTFPTTQDVLIPNCSRFAMHLVKELRHFIWFSFWRNFKSTFSVLNRIRRIKLETTTTTTTTPTTPGTTTSEQSTSATTTTTHIPNPNFDWERKFNKEDLLKFKLRMNQLHPKSNYGANQVVFNRPAIFFR